MGDNIKEKGNGSLGKDKTMVLDGGFSTQLGRHVKDRIDGDVLWSVRFLATNPQAVINTHLDFLKAGSDIIITNTYQASIGGFMKHLQLSKQESYSLIKEAVNLAKTARNLFKEQFNKDGPPEQPLIAGSVGPYGAFLHDGSEYSGSYADFTSAETMREWHQPRIEALIEGGVDILAIETIPCRKEAEMLINLIKDYPQVKAWLSLSCAKDGKSLAHGEDFQDTLRYCYDLNPEQLVAVGTNCLAPKLVEMLFKDINKGREDNPMPLIVYPNSGETYSVEVGQEGWIDKDKCRPLDSYVSKWLDMGIYLIGGCCRTYAEDINKIKDEVSKWKLMRSSGRTSDN